jgi:hypothetical protein
MVSSAIANPTDVLKVRMQVLGSQSQRGIVGCFQEVYHEEGVAGLWRVSYLLIKKDEAVLLHAKQALRGGRDTAEPTLNPGTRRGLMVSATSLPLYPQERDLVLIIQVAGWTSGLV